MSHNSCIPDHREVAVLMHSESESDEDLGYTNVNYDMPSTVNVNEVPGYIEVSDETTRADAHEFQHPVKEPFESDHIKTDPAHSDTIQRVQSPATVSPQNKEDADRDEDVRNSVLETCTQLLLKLETVHLSILHLQYSLHAGTLATSQVECVDRSSRLWAWDQSSQLGEITPVGISHPLKFSEDEFPVEILDSFNLPDDVLSGLDVFGIPELVHELDRQFDDNIDNVPGTSEVLNGAATEGCF